MAREIGLDELESVLAELHYPVERETAAESFGDVTLELADGTENLGHVIGSSSDDGFDNADDLASEVIDLLPQSAVGEPHQGNGEG